jgi:ketosteroid isomerase-like protein
MARLTTVVALGIGLGACASGSAPTRSTPVAATVALSTKPEPSDDVARLAWMQGDWQSEHTRVAFRLAGDSLFGVTFLDGNGSSFYSATIMGRRHDRFEFRAYGRGDSEELYVGGAQDDTSIAFTREPAGFTTRLSRDGADAILATITPTGEAAEEKRLTRVTPAPAPAPALEQADRAFAAATAARGVDGWVEWFDAEGAQWEDGEDGQPGKRVVGHDAVRAFMTPVFARPGFRLEWEPFASGLAPAGDLGFTIGAWQGVKLGDGGAREVRGHGAYVTIWKKQADGGWKVLFDTGDPVDPR